MRLATIELSGCQRFGAVATHPVTQENWIILPEEAELAIYQYATSKTAGYEFAVPHFLASRPWPDTMTAFLDLGETGMEALSKLLASVRQFLQTGDGYMLLSMAGHRLEDVKLLPPIPASRLLFGLVANGPAFIRNHRNIPMINLLPQGHQRPRSAAIGAGEDFVLEAGAGDHWAFNSELGVIIGKEARNVSIQEAMDYVAGYTIVNDTYAGEVFMNRHPRMREDTDQYSRTAYGWMGKTGDASCAVGPWLVTKEEVGHPYDLDMFTRQNGQLRDKANTCGMLVGIERTIAYYSSFATLYPGDILHMGAMGKDGLTVKREWAAEEGDVIECGIEKLGVLKNRVIYRDQMTRPQDWKKETPPHASFPVRELLKHGKEAVDRNGWQLKDTGNFAILYGNYNTVAQEEEYPASSLARHLWAPVSALGSENSRVAFPCGSSKRRVGAEIAVVIGKVAKHASQEEAEECILGYVPMVCAYDTTLADSVIRGTLPREWTLPEIYARWSDGCNVAGSKPLPLCASRAGALAMRLYADGMLVWEGNSREYTVSAPQAIAFISESTTLLPGDVITLGRLGKQAVIDMPEEGSCTCRLEVEGFPPLLCEITIILNTVCENGGETP